MEGIKPYNGYQILLIGLQPIIAAMSTFVCYALVSSGLYVYSSEWHDVFKQTQIVFLFSFTLGILFEFLSSKWTTAFITGGLKKIMTTGLESLLNWIKK